MKRFTFSMVLCIAVAETCFGGPTRPVRSSTFDWLMPSGPAWDSHAEQGQWFKNPLTDAVHVKSWEFHDDDDPWSIHGIVQDITFDGSPASNIVAFTVLATVSNNLPSVFASTENAVNSHNEQQTSGTLPYAGKMRGTRITAEFAVADMSLLPDGTPPYFTDPVSPQLVPPHLYFIEAVNEDEWAWYCWTPDDPEFQPPGDFQVPTWNLGDIPPGTSASVLMMFQITNGDGTPGFMPRQDYRHSVIRYSQEQQADVLYNRHTSLKISHWLDTLLIDNGSFIGAPPPPPGEFYEPEPPEYIYASDASVFFDPELDFGDAPDGPYPTLRVNDGARHVVMSGIHLGQQIDAEPDGQPDPNALGDDNHNLADEDGVVFTSILTPGRMATVTVECSTAGFLFAWIDFAGNGNWADPGDQIFSMQAVSPGFNPLSFAVPSTAVAGTTFARFRFTTLQSPLDYFGLAEDGEVEDYKVLIQKLDYGDAWDCPSTPAYPTLRIHDGARHVIVPGVHLGEGVDADPDGQPDLNALGDDQDAVHPGAGNIPYPPGDEEGVDIPSPLIAGATVMVQVVASTNGYLNAWIDWNANQSWIEPEEHVFQNYPLHTGTNTLALSVPEPPVLAAGGPHSRWRFTTYAPLTPAFTGMESDGEVEDYEVKLEVLDFGDAPAPYPTLLADDGARHMVPSTYWLGTVPPDHEPDGQPDPDALGDDNSGIGDEDGVSWTGSLIRGSNTTFNIVASTNGWLNAWIDFSQNGNWNHPADQIAADLGLSSGTNLLVVAVPADAALGRTFGRFRFSGYKGLQPTGIAYDGEVEDYALAIYQTNPSGNIVITNLTYSATADTVTIEWNGESPLVYETQHCDVLTSNPTWTAWGPWVDAAPYAQTNDVNGVTSRFFRVSAPFVAP